MMPPTPAPDLPLPKAARVINIITALTGLVASGLLGLVVLPIGENFDLLGSPPIAALLIVTLLCWSCGAYRAAFTRFQRLPLPKLIFQTFVMSQLAVISFIIFQDTHSRPDAYAPWMPSATTVLLVFIPLTFLSHLLSVAIRLIYKGNEGQSG